MARFSDPPAGCFIYLMLSIVINLFILILRISAQDLQNTTVPTIAHRFDPSAISNSRINTGRTTETGFTSAVEIETPDQKAHGSKLSETQQASETTIIAPLVVPGLSLQRNTKDDLELNGGTAVDFADEAVATVIPVSTVVSLTAAPNEPQIATEAVSRQPAPLQRHRNNSKAAVSRNQLSSRTAIKSSSPSAASNGTQKFHKTDAPMLNYIFDSHLANKHRHYDPRYGPHFDDVHVTEQVGNVTAQLGSVAYLNCRIRLLQDKTVTWLKREQNNSHIQLLTIGVHTYSFDKRFSVEFEQPNNWPLRIADTNKSDEGLYECQISTHPPRAIRTQFFVKAPEVFIVDEFEQPLVDKYYEVDSTIELVCVVRHVSMLSSTVNWLHGNELLNFDMTRGGISVKTDLMENGANSTLFIAKVRKTDTGNYTCSIGPNDFYTINVQVLNGESLAELYHGSAVSSRFGVTLVNWLGVCIPTVIFILSSCYYDLISFARRR